MTNLDEIVKPRKSESRDDRVVLDEYVESQKIAQKIYNEYIKLFVNGKGFPLDERTSRVGIISNCMALSTLLELESMGANIDSGSEKISKLIGYILSEIYVNGSEPVFGASPYIKDDDEKNVHLDMYVETMSKVLIVMTDLRTFLLRDDIRLDFSVECHGKKLGLTDLINIVEKTIVYCIVGLNKSCLPNSMPFKYRINGEVVERGEVSPSVDFRGWTYCDVSAEDTDGYGVSIYFTYHATNAFLSFYKTFSDLFDAHFENHELPDKKEIKRDKIFFDRNIGIITEFRKKTICAGRYFESKLIEHGVNLALDYVGKDLRPVTFENIANSQKSNDVINTVFVLAILINSGLDDDYESVGQKSYLYEQLQFCTSNVKKIYSILKKNSNEDAVNSYSLIFNEKYPKKELAAIQYLRRQCSDVSVFDFVPLFCNTYSIISQYLIKYPQREMVDILAMIMENRMDDRWLWSVDGYDANNSLYYVFALENFYDYYQKCELPLSKRGEKYNLAAQTSEKEKAEIAKDLDELTAKHNKLIEDYNNKQSKLDKEVYEIARQAAAQCIEELLNKYFDDMVVDTIDFAIDAARKLAQDPSCSLGDSLYSSHPRAKLMHLLADPDNYAEMLRDKEVNKDTENLREILKNDMIQKRLREIARSIKK